jgi:alpha-amylase
MAPRMALALVLHNHQPVGNFGWVVGDVFRTAYEPMIGALERHPGVRVGLHYSGPLLEWLEREQPAAIDRLRVLVEREQVEMLGGAHFEPVLAALPEADRHGQLRLMTAEVERLFGRRPRGAWLAERVWEPSLPADLAAAGYEYTVLDDNHLRAASVPEDAMWGTYTTDDQGRLLTIFGTEQGLRYRIPFGQVDDLIGYLREHATEDGHRLGTMGDDGEKFGAWPGTFEHCWGEDAWVDRCFEALEANEDWLRTVRPSDWLESEAPIGRIYVPTSSYVEMTQWALPADEANVFHALLEDARRSHGPEARFLRGGFWRAFQTRYREINDLHKQMLRVSRKVAAMAEGHLRDRARDHLYRGQSNDVYWHGLFGGIYIVHMRMATLAELIRAEDMADAWAWRLHEAGSGGWAQGAVLEDVDLDGRPEVLVTAPGQTITIDLDEGAGIGAWDLRASRLALASVLRRRPEAYHEALLNVETAVASAGGGATAEATERSGGSGPRTIHEATIVKEAGLDRVLHYDWHERRSALVHLLPAAAEPGAAGPTSLEELVTASYREQGDFADQPWQVVALDGHEVTARRDGHLFVEGGPHGLAVTKQLSMGGDRLAPTLELTVTAENTGGVDESFELALEWGLNLMGGGANPRAWYELSPADGHAARRLPHDSSHDEPSATLLRFGNDDAGVAVEMAASPPARLTWFPIETVTNSEAGVERTYQGSALLCRWPMRLAPGEATSTVLRFAVSQARDLVAEEDG